MIALLVVVACERVDLRFKVSGQEVVLQQDPVLQCLVPALVSATIERPDLSLSAPTAPSLRMMRRNACMLRAFAGVILGEVASDLGWSVA